MFKRKIRPGKMLGATFLAFFAAAIFKIIRAIAKEISKNQKAKRYF